MNIITNTSFYHSQYIRNSRKTLRAVILLASTDNRKSKKAKVLLTFANCTTRQRCWLRSKENLNWSKAFKKWIIDDWRERYLYVKREREKEKMCFCFSKKIIGDKQTRILMIFGRSFLTSQGRLRIDVCHICHLSLSVNCHLSVSDSTV